MGHAVAVVSLGCAKNLVDSEVMLGLLEQAGHELVEDVEDAEIIIVNTCAFIEPAVEEAVEALLDLAELKADGAQCLICAGCLTSRYGEELLRELPEVDALVGPGSVDRIAEVVQCCLAGERVMEAGSPPCLCSADTPRVRTGPQWLAHLKIADGCSHHCTYCLIPQLRGPYRSRPPGDIRAEVAGLIGEGVREICVIAQDTSAWGRDLTGEHSLAGLLESLELGGWDGWLRLQYLHPTGISDELLEVVAGTEQIVPYFDIPLQHADEAVLRRMGRGGDAQRHLALLERVRAAVPDGALRTTFIVGHPGETRQRFERLLAFVREARFDRLSAFVYWDEPGTRSECVGEKVPREQARDRLDELMHLQQEISREINQGLVGERLRVLVEEPGDDPATVVGRTYRDAPGIDGNAIIRRGPQVPPAGHFVDVLVTEALEHDLRGRATQQ
ncbi:MAG: 30S ribosomal protein S12 methylthiotransferase RimO [Armatimonadota bacterium]|nr:30S ribosomal protein S12 methylthiotransferase RimO [Armatimonadota bacterium]